MKKFTAFVLSLFLILSLAGANSFAYEPDDPCNLFGYDPDTQDNYEIYGDKVFLRNNPVKSPSGDVFIRLNSYTSKNIVNEAKTYEDFCKTISKDYFPELDIDWLYCTSFGSEERYNSLKESFLDNKGSLYFIIQLKDNSKEAVTDALIDLAPRSDTDIEEVIHLSYDLSDVSTALKVIAGWDVPYSVLYNYDGSENIDLSDVTIMLKAIAKWKNDGWYWEVRGYGDIIEELR